LGIQARVRTLARRSPPFCVFNFMFYLGIAFTILSAVERTLKYPLLLDLFRASSRVDPQTFLQFNTSLTCLNDLFGFFRHHVALQLLLSYFPELNRNCAWSYLNRHRSPLSRMTPKKRPSSYPDYSQLFFSRPR
jgi:hypothetical protein